MSDYEYLTTRGWVPVAVLSDETVIVWSEPSDGNFRDKLTCSTTEAVATQTSRDQGHPCLTTKTLKAP